MIRIYGTLGPACDDPKILEEMLRQGMTGIRLNLSHISLEEAAGELRELRRADGGCVSIPMTGLKASLNVGVAFGILMQAWISRLRQ